MRIFRNVCVLGVSLIAAAYLFSTCFAERVFGSEAARFPSSLNISSKDSLSGNVEAGHSHSPETDVKGTQKLYTESEAANTDINYDDNVNTITWPVAVNGIIYDLVNEEVAVMGCEDNVSSLEFVDEINGLPVTKISAYAFYGCSQLSGSLIIPKYVTVIEEGAFEECTGLNGNLQLPYGLIEIQAKAFLYCSNLTGQLIIPDTVEIIGTTDPDRIYDIMELALPYGAFEYCDGFTGPLSLPSSLKYIGDLSFKDCTGLSGELVIGEKVEVIGSEAFLNCAGLTGELCIPSSVQQIKTWAFNNCSGFNKLTLGENIRHIEGCAFVACGGFEGQLIIPDNVTYIGQRAFERCVGFTGDLLLHLKNNISYIGIGAFGYCRGMTGKLTLPENIEEIGAGAFCGCNFTGEVFIPKSVKKLGGILEEEYNWESPFDQCYSITKLTVEQGNPSYCDIDGVLFDCSGEMLLVCPCGRSGKYCVPEGIKHIGPHAFAWCSFITEIVVPDSVIDIGPKGFYRCDSMTTLTLGEGITSIGDDTFVGSILLNIYYAGSREQWDAIDVNIDNGNGILNWARVHFAKCEHIWSDVYYSWTDDYIVTAYRTCILDDTHIESETTQFKRSLFKAPTDTDIGSTLYSVSFENPVFPEYTIIEEDIPALNDLSVLRLPDNLSVIQAEAFTGLSCEAVIIPDGCTTIGSKAFANCPNLIYVKIPASITNMAEDAFEGSEQVRIDIPK